MQPLQNVGLFKFNLVDKRFKHSHFKQAEDNFVNSRPGVPNLFPSRPKLRQILFCDNKQPLYLFLYKHKF